MRIRRSTLKRIIAEAVAQAPLPWENLPPESQWEDIPMTEDDGGFQFDAARALGVRPTDIVYLSEDSFADFARFDELFNQFRPAGSPVRIDGGSTQLGDLHGIEVVVVDIMGNPVICARKSDV
jgi:hypothetical protein